MAISTIALLVVCLQASPVQAQNRQRKVAIVVDSDNAAKGFALEKISAAIRSQASVSIYELDRAMISDPIEKGKIVAALQTRDMIVAVGDNPTAFVTRELEETPVYFVGAGLVGGDQLASGLVTGMFSYNVESLLDAVKILWPGKLGLAYTPGYEPVADWIRKGAADRKLLLSEKKIASLKEFTPAMRDLLERSRAIWVLGDPLLVRGAGFEFLRERALSGKVPIIAAGLPEIEQGAFLAFEPKPDSLIFRAAETIRSLLGGEIDRAAALRPAPPGGTLLFNGTLSGKWSILPPTGLLWRVVR